MIRMEMLPVEYAVHADDDGYIIEREGIPYDHVSYELVRIYIDDETLLESYMSGAFAYQTNNLPPNYED